ncbi:MAG: DUF3168 domain-containing protein [Alphaproteobacteria bacterium HGW-Alphaproteobacteria-15]|nr:MAG: DUF3168 domain-containing protein [Alphaproteobacteria bacterium HGW-Alphaproteobacteria-15]
MSVRIELQGALCTLLEHALDVVPVFDAPPVRAAPPYVVVEEPVLADWSTKDMRGREGRITIRVLDRGERPIRLRALSGLAEDAVEMMAPDLAGGWRIVTLTMLRERIVRSGEHWMATSEFRVRMLRTH